MVLPIFGFVTVHRRPLADGIAAEADWMAACAATGRSAAHLWQGLPGLVVPRRATLLPGWPAAGAPDAGHGQVHVRATGGGVVPQGPGLWNLSLLWPAPSATPVDTDGLYTALCAELTAALARLGLVAVPQPVAGSFCDGRYNLAVGGSKLAGTAQAWRRVGGQPVVLAHAVLIVDADPRALTQRANDFEAAIGSDRRYRSEALTSIAREVPDPADIEARTLTVLAEQFARVLPPRVQTSDLQPRKETHDGPA